MPGVLSTPRPMPASSSPPENTPVSVTSPRVRSGSDTSIPLFAFIFLVALGVDYNIFLMARVREETAQGSLELEEESDEIYVEDACLRALAIAGVARAVELRGHAVVQAIRSPRDDLVLECNSRIGGASSADTRPRTHRRAVPAQAS